MVNGSALTEARKKETDISMQDNTIRLPLTNLFIESHSRNVTFPRLV